MTSKKIPSGYFFPSEIAKMFKCKERTITKGIEYGLIASVKISGLGKGRDRIMIHKTELKMIEQQIPIIRTKINEELCALAIKPSTSIKPITKMSIEERDGILKAIQHLSKLLIADAA